LNREFSKCALERITLESSPEYPGFKQRFSEIFGALDLIDRLGI
jgi:hypothetical protein